MFFILHILFQYTSAYLALSFDVVKLNPFDKIKYLTDNHGSVPGGGLGEGGGIEECMRRH